MLNEAAVGTEGRPAPGPAMTIAERYDALLFDLDGVIYRGDAPVPGAADTLAEARRRGMRLLFLTNNSSRTPDQVAAKLHGIGIEATPDEILTSALATAALIRREGLEGSTAFVIGERGIREALSGAGVRVVEDIPEKADLVVIGFDRTADYRAFTTASLLVERGARLVATNADRSYPAQDGQWPGAGALLAVVTTTTGATPTVVGKPSSPMYEAAAEATGATHPLAVGDRVDTDVAGASSMGWDSLLVFTGVGAPPDLLTGPALPAYVGPDVSFVLTDPGPPPARFRPASLGDAAALEDLLEDAGLVSSGVPERIDRTVVLDGLVADPPRSVATACLDDAGGFGILRSVAVRRERQGLGLGMLAAAAAVHAGRARGIDHVSLFTETAPTFFARLGFSPVDRDDLPEPVRTSRHAAEECATSATAMALRVA